MGRTGKIALRAAHTCCKTKDQNHPHKKHYLNFIFYFYGSIFQQYLHLSLLYCIHATYIFVFMPHQQFLQVTFHTLNLLVVVPCLLPSWQCTFWICFQFGPKNTMLNVVYASCDFWVKYFIWEFFKNWWFTPSYWMHSIFFIMISMLLFFTHFILLKNSVIQ